MEEKKAVQPLATADFHLTGKGWDETLIDETVHAELHKSGAFQYGNQTCTVLTWNARKGMNRTEVYDTRYENVTSKTFTQFVLKMLQNMVMDTVNVEAI